MKINKSSLTKYCTIVIILFPIIGQYGLFTKAITLADAAIMPALALIIVFNIKKKFLLSDKHYLLFGLWFIITSTFIAPIWTFFTMGVITSILQNIMYFLVILLVAKYYFNCELALKIYSYIGIILCIIVFLQTVLNITTGNIVPWVVNSNIFPTIYTTDDFFTGGYVNLVERTSFRPSGLFSEPALLAQYLAPCLVLNIYKKNKTRFDYLLILSITAAVLVANSANGTIYILIIWIVAGTHELIKKIKYKEWKIKKKHIVLGVILLILTPQISKFVIDKILSNDAFSLMHRLTEIFDSKGVSSGSMRVIRGWKIYFGMTLPEQIVGIGTGNIIQYLNLYPNIVPMFTKSYNGYMSGLSAIFVNSGFVGGALYMVWWIKYFVSKQNTIKCLQIFLMLYLLASNSFNTAQFILTTILVISLKKTTKTNASNPY